MNRGIVLTIAFLVVSALFCLESHAYPIQYSWAGTIVPTGAADPWLIGAQGQPFALDGTVSSGASDLLYVDVQFAAFNIESAHLLVGGQSVPYIGDGVIDFTDNSAGSSDLVTLGGKFQRFGETVEVESLVVLHPATFEFIQSIEPPPLFASTANVDRAACCGGTYTLIVEPGSAVTVIPEPASIVNGVVAVLLVMAAQRRSFLLGIGNCLI